VTADEDSVKAAKVTAVLIKYQALPKRARGALPLPSNDAVADKAVNRRAPGAASAKPAMQRPSTGTGTAAVRGAASRRVGHPAGR
jgi:hypothetical protein